MSNFDYAVEKVIKNEGGYSDDPNDLGHATNMGITLNLYRDYHPSATKADIQTLTEAEAKRIYRLAFWDLAPFELIRSLRIATSLFDASVNSGIGNGVRILQKACNTISLNKINTDGLLGKNTLKLTNTLDSTELLRAIRKEREEFYKEIVERNPSQEKFLIGWLNRARNT